MEKKVITSGTEGVSWRIPFNAIMPAMNIPPKNAALRDWFAYI